MIDDRPHSDQDKCGNHGNGNQDKEGAAASRSLYISDRRETKISCFQ